MLYHISEDPEILRFEPRPSPYHDEPVVWAIDDEHLRNYLLPRDAPRVTFYPIDSTVAEDVVRFVGTGGARAVVAVEAAWADRIRSATLYCYHLSEEQFVEHDPGAGYFVSREAVAPVRVEPVSDVFRALSIRSVEIRILPSLWPLHDAIVSSTLQFSMIRMRNAQPRI